MTYRNPPLGRNLFRAVGLGMQFPGDRNLLPITDNLFPRLMNLETTLDDLNSEMGAKPIGTAPYLMPYK